MHRWRRSTNRKVMFIALLALIGLVGCVPFAAAQPSPAAPQATGLALQVDLAAARFPIDPLIYGVNSYGLSESEAAALAAAINLPIRRWGGNTTSRYNWQTDFYNTGSDYFFENIPAEGRVASELPNNSATNRFIAANRAAGIESLITVPLIGWVAKNSPDQHPFDCGFRVSRYQAQQATDPYDPDCGNGIAAAGNPNFAVGERITGNDPTDTSITADPSFVQAWVEHLVGRFGGATAGGVRFYALDNEPGLWNETHRDVFPGYLSFDELTNRGIAYAQAIKAADPNALILGPVQDGWTRYFYASYGSYTDAMAQADRDAKGVPFVVWYLQQFRQAEQTSGQRLLDYLDLHYYPQASGVTLQPAGDADRQALRLRSTRALWDPSYVDESWIVDTEGGNTSVQLLPRMRAWRDTFYPGTKLAITEYNWGGLEHINGALTQADVLGIFGRERLDMAMLWGPPTADQPGAFALRMYRNYDGSGSSFGDQGLPASSADQERVAIYAAERSSDGALTIMLINKSSTAEAISLTFAHGANGNSIGTIEQYRYSSADLTQITRLSDQNLNGSLLNTTLPASSITLLVVPADAPRSFTYLPLVRS